MLHSQTAGRKANSFKTKIARAMELLMQGDFIKDALMQHPG